MARRVGAAGVLVAVALLALAAGAVPVGDNSGDAERKRNAVATVLMAESNLTDSQLPPPSSSSRLLNSTAVGLVENRSSSSPTTLGKREPKDTPEAAAGGKALAKYPLTRIFFINLADRLDRLDYMQDMLAPWANKPGVKVERKEAVRVPNYQAALADERYKLYLQDRPVLNYIKSGAHANAGFVVSVYLSHVTLYQSILLDQKFSGLDDLILVLEDDTAVPDNIQQRLDAAMRFVPDDWDVVRIGHWGELREEDLVAPGVYAAKQPFWIPPHTAYYGGAHAVLLRARTLPHVVRALDRVALSDFDGMLTTCCKNLRSYMLAENLVELHEQLQDDSDNPSHSVAVQGVGPSDEKIQLQTNNLNVKPEPVPHSSAEKVLLALTQGTFHPATAATAGNSRSSNIGESKPALPQRKGK